ncbi:MAG: SDR family NAD(P)-dependent oxidoreductase [Candidatus Brocadiia bacterium]
MLTIDLKDKVALVVGGSRGIGGAVTRALAAAGAMVTFTHTGSAQRQDEVVALVAAIRKDGGRAEAIALDACDAPGTTSAVDALVRTQGRIDLLVHNVGQNAARSAEQVTDEEWARFLDINLTSGFNSVRAVLPHMVRARYGRIILIGSSVLYSGGGGAIDYAAGKAGLTGMMMYLCREYARRGILTNIVHPCVIETDLLRERYRDGAARQKLLSQIPVGRLGKAEDIAGLVAYLASPWGDYICGQSILVDGGRTFFQ